MTDVQQRAAAKEFAAYWKNRGDEKQETQRFWIDLLRNVYGVPNPEQSIEFEVPVKLSHTSFIDGYLADTRVLIEQKGADIDLKKGYKQSDGQMLTPYQQARRYAGYLPFNKTPRWIVVCNFQTFEIHDMNFPNGEPEVLMLADLEKDYSRLQFLVDTGSKTIKKEMEVSLQAGELVGVLYDALLKQYKDPTAPETLKSLNALCVRLVFCLYAEDAGIFGRRDMFHDYLKNVPAAGIRKALAELFRVLDQKPEERDKYLADDNPALAAFPYVNGGLFADENIEIPPFTEELKNILLSKASEDFDWSAISPTIFGAVFESTLNPETRRSGGMHYTSIENIHKVIDPLFLDGLKAELEEIKEIAVEKTRVSRLKAYQSKLAGLTFLDPACGSGNFLTESYISLRRLENDALRYQTNQITMGDYANPIQVSIHQFYGIEINDFAATVAKTALWIAESQMLKETEDIIAHQIDFLPLKSYANITEGNALRLNWEDVVPKEKLDYIMGNPPFVGARLMDASQKSDVNLIFEGWKNVGNLDYVCCWYKKAVDIMQKNRNIATAFVSTNSISQGEQVAILWKPFFEKGVFINFAYRTFKWNNEAKGKAAVHCVIIGFGMIEKRNKFIVDGDICSHVENINGYLVGAQNICIESRRKPLCDIPQIGIGNKPIDGGYYLFTEDGKNDFIAKEPASKEYFKKWIGSDEFINGKKRYCLWLGDCEPADLKNMPECLKRVEAVRKYRLASKSKPTRKLADKPRRFHVENMPNNNYIVIPESSSKNRRYIPIGFLSPDIFSSNLVKIIPRGTLYHFGILTSSVHNCWMRTVAGRLKSDYRYSKEIVYNNFPWPEANKKQQEKIAKLAQAVLDARKQFPGSSLADLYDPLTMPPVLLEAHQNLDREVMRLYGFSARMTDSAIVAKLFELYQNIVMK